METKITYLDSPAVKGFTEKCAMYQKIIRVDPSGLVSPQFYTDWMRRYREFEAREDDVWVVSFPKAGTTWTQEMVWGIMNRDYTYTSPGATDDTLIRFPFFEFDSMLDPSLQNELAKMAEYMQYGKQWERVNSMKSPRLIKSHLPYDLLPPQVWTKKSKTRGHVVQAAGLATRLRPIAYLPTSGREPYNTLGVIFLVFEPVFMIQIVYVARNPKDVVVSYFNHFRGLEGYKGTLNDFVTSFVQDVVIGCPFWPHVEEFWKRRNDPQIIFITYEEMKKDLKTVADRVGKFLDRPMNNEQLEQLTENLSIEAMRKRECVNYDKVAVNKDFRFLRKGKAGGWKEELSEESKQSLDEWVNEQMKKTDLRFDWC